MRMYRAALMAGLLVHAALCAFRPGAEDEIKRPDADRPA